jgi:hypothetical protein
MTELRKEAGTLAKMSTASLIEGVSYLRSDTGVIFQEKSFAHEAPSSKANNCALVSTILAALESTTMGESS